jgi:tripartite-type tricarboxylate transporter receptor subunit TctC
MSIGSRILLNCIFMIAMPLAIHAQVIDNFPNRPVRLVLPFSPGGTTDIMSRLLSIKFQEETGQALIVDNKPGAGGMIATELVQRSAADGYTLLLGSSAQLALNPGLYGNIRYDPVRDFAPIALLGATPNVLLAHPSQPMRSLANLISEARSRPGQLAFASPGSGSTAHLAAELLKQQTGTSMVHVPYRGAGPAVSDVLGGQVPFIFVAIPSIVQHVKSGKLRPLAVTGTHRSQALPDVPTFAETLPGFEAVGWYGVLAPAGTSPEIVARLHSTIRKITATPEVRAAWSAQGIEMLGGSPSEFSDYMKSELKKWTQVIKSSGAKAD